MESSKKDAPLAFLFFPRTSIRVNYAFAEIRTEYLDELCRPVKTNIPSASLSFNESVKPFYGLAVVAELRLSFTELTEAIDHQLRTFADFFRRHCASARRKDTANTQKILARGPSRSTDENRPLLPCRRSQLLFSTLLHPLRDGRHGRQWQRQTGYFGSA